MRKWLHQHRGRLFGALLAAAIFAAGFSAGTLGTSTRAQGSNGDALAILDEVLGVIQQQYVEPVETDVLIDGALRGMVDALDDPFSAYMTAEEFEFMNDDLEGEIQGIGVVIRTDPDTSITEVISVLDGTPAQEAGILPGDIFNAVDGVPVSELDDFMLGQRIRGEVGTTVTITMLRGDELIDFVITRAIITVPIVEARVIEDIALIELSSFSANARDQLEETFETLDINSRDGLILDLRDNPGGFLSSAINVGSLFIEEGVIVSEIFRDGTERVLEATGDFIEIEVPIVVLVNEASASASELIAGALQDREQAVIIGEQTFGKGTVQTWQPLSNGGGVRITIARWFTPDGTSIHENGITPDLYIDFTPDADTTDATDLQLQAAIDYLQGEDVQEILPPVEEEAAA